ncbi:hypothetical protein SSX86_013110 [Deinandra increscens subsp. villosa]|uniref:BHLH domain-containing protein n=1 Tax=Deinandra increscens subsp. villosa TaxID=3103831 RepID=A0AAP0DD15_9ASTR
MATSYDGLKHMLQSAVQSVQWTYIIFWKFSPQQRVLEWGDGYYNGAIKTRKTVEPVEVSTEEAALSRSEQLRELYDSLASGEQQVAENQRPSVALSPEDLTESEWFYLMCASFSFAPGVGLVGKAYAKQQHLWLTDANEVDSNIFTRYILAKTVICIPLLNGVVELGTTDKVEETKEFIQHVKLFFMVGNNNLILPLPPKPTLSAHSSNTTFSPNQVPETIKRFENTDSMDEDLENEEDEEEEDEDNVDDVDDEGDENGPDSTCHVSSFQDNESAMVETNELLELGMSPDIRFGSPVDGSGSSNLDSSFNFLPTNLGDSSGAPAWSDNFEFRLQTSVIYDILEYSNRSLSMHAEELLAPEVNHFSRTVSTLLHHHHPPPRSDPDPPHRNSPIDSSFTSWTHQPDRLPLPATSQRLLKYTLFTLPFLHYSTTLTTPASRLRNEQLSASHVLAERRRREKLNERFVILRTLVPLVTKMDKASILGDTIEYVKELRKKVRDLEAGGGRFGMRAAEGGGGTAEEVEVSIIENDALVEMRCGFREGLLVDVVNKLREIGVEIRTVQSFVDGGMFTAEMRAKVKVRQGTYRKKVSITQVKKAIHQIISL